jgi:hypothetical protein
MPRGKVRAREAHTNNKNNNHLFNMMILKVNIRLDFLV